MKAALEVDESAPISDNHSLLHPPRAHTETLLLYVGVHESNPVVPLDGTNIYTLVAGFLPTSRGTVTLGGKNADDDPHIDPNYYNTEVDRFVFRSGVRRLLEMLGTDSGREIVEHELPPDGHKAMVPGDVEITDEELDERIKIGAK